MMFNNSKSNDETHTHSRKKRTAIYQSLLVAIVLCVGVSLVWHYWPTIMMTSLRWQKETTDYISGLFYEHTVSAYLSILAVSLLYGILHALGPGHGKVVVSTYLATHKTKVKTGIYITIASAIMQGIVAIVLVSLFIFVWHETMHQLNATVSELVEFSGFLVLALGAYLILMVLKGVFRQSYSHRHHDHEHHSHEHHDHEHTSHEHDHHGHECGCGHKHSADPEELNKAQGWGEYLGIIASIGIRPCSGAILVLFFSHLADLYWIGVIGSLMMSVGTALTTSTIALLTVSGRKVVQYYSNIDVKYAQSAVLVLKSVAGLLLILLGFVLVKMPAYGMSPIFS